MFSSETISFCCLFIAMKFFPEIDFKVKKIFEILTYQFVQFSVRFDIKMTHLIKILLILLNKILILYFLSFKQFI